MSFKIPWERYSRLFKFISFFANDCKEVSKKKLNDLLFLTFIDEAIPEYDFSFYAHGIYSDQLEMDLEMLENFHAISIESELEPKIKILSEPPFIKDSPASLNQYKLSKIKNLIEGKNTKELELISSLFFIEKTEKNSVQQKKLLKEIKSNISSQLLEKSFSWFTEMQRDFLSACEPELTANQ